MLIIIFFISFAGISLYFLLKPSTDIEYEQALRIEPISEPKSKVTKQRSTPTLRELGDVAY